MKFQIKLQVHYNITKTKNIKKRIQNINKYDTMNFDHQPWHQ